MTAHTHYLFSVTTAYQSKNLLLPVSVINKFALFPSFSSEVCYFLFQLTALCHEAGLCAMTESREADKVHMRHFEAAFNTVRPQTTLEMIKFYEEYSSKSHIL